MARRKKDGRRATGIQSKRGILQIVTSKPVMKDGVRKVEKKWISTGLPDTPENVRKASEIRARLLNTRTMSIVDRNILLSDYIDLVLEKKKREVSDTTYSAYFYKGKKIYF